MTVIATISVTPIGWKAQGLGEYVGAIVSQIQAATVEIGGSWETTSMNTIIEVDTPDQVFQVFKSGLAKVQEFGVRRALVSIQMDMMFDNQKNRMHLKKDAVYNAIQSKSGKSRKAIK